jgi:thermostable 8-oxoguanine DNA glycosylase
MINPTTITNYNRTQSELEEFLLFSIMVAGKSAKQTALKLNQFLNMREDCETPLEFVDNLVHNGELDNAMKVCRLGQYGRLGSAFRGIVKLRNRLHEASVDVLESIKGIGPKTARFFVLHSREGASHAVLDTHILKWLKLHGENAPKSTPSGKKYAMLEQAFLTYAWKYEMQPADLDLHIWKQYSQK